MIWNFIQILKFGFRQDITVDVGMEKCKSVQMTGEIMKAEGFAVDDDYIINDFVEDEFYEIFKRNKK